MPQVKISELPAAGTANLDMQFEVNDTGTSRSVTLDKIAAALPNKGVYDAKSFGVVADGVTDDFAAIRAGLDYVNSIGGGVLALPEGTMICNTPLQNFGFENVWLRGAGQGATILKRTVNFVAASIRFVLGTGNIISDLTVECNGYPGRGIYLQDIRSKAIRCAVLNCPERPFGMNGGSNTGWGLDAGGREDTDGAFTGYVFYPEKCELQNNYAYRSGATALSQKQMHGSIIINNVVETCWSEGVTSDVTNYSYIAGNRFKDISLVDGWTEFPDQQAGSGYLTVGGGGVGGVGIDAAYGTRFVNNHIDGVNTDTATLNNRTKAAINFVNNVAPSFGCVITGNTIKNAKTGVYVKSGSGGDNFKHIITGNTFDTTGTAVGSGSAQYGDVWIDFPCSGMVVADNKHTGGSLLLTDNGVLNDARPELFCDRDVNFAPELRGGATAGTCSYSSRTLSWQKVGNWIHYEVSISWSGHTGGGQLRLYGLPAYTKVDNAMFVPVGAYNLAVTGQVWAAMYNSDDFFRFYVINNGTRTNANVPASGSLEFSGSYKIGN